MRMMIQRVLLLLQELQLLQNMVLILSPRFMNFAVSVPRGGGQAVTDMCTGGGFSPPERVLAALKIYYALFPCVTQQERNNRR